MRKFIKIATERDDNLLWELLVEHDWRVGHFKHRIYAVPEEALPILKAKGISFQLIEPTEWRWENGYPVEPLDKYQSHKA